MSAAEATTEAATTDEEPRESGALLPGEDPNDSAPISESAEFAVSQGTIPWLAAALAVSLGLSILLIRRLNRIGLPPALAVSTSGVASVAVQAPQPRVAKPPKPPKTAVAPKATLATPAAQTTPAAAALQAAPRAVTMMTSMAAESVTLAGSEAAPAVTPAVKPTKPAKLTAKQRRYAKHLAQ